MDFLSLLQQKEVVLFDGSLGTQLMIRGLKPGEIPDSWNIEKSEIIQSLFKEYFSSGSDMVQTATFRANGVALRGYGLENSIESINDAAGRILRSICPSDKCVIGDIGPSGEFLPPVGKITINELDLGFRQQAQALDPYIDAWHLETFSDLQEIKTAITAVQEVSDKPIIASMTFKKTPRGYFTIIGNSITQCVNELIDLGITAVGSNCTLGSEDFFGLMKAMREITSDFPLSVKPNAGQPTVENGVSVYKQTPEEFAEDMQKILDLDVQVIGGCCGTGPEHIRLLREIIDKLNARRF
ncbi:MAG: homocysteine S-methyltransferase family protein [Candidatus Hermodarchaeota archaeon]